MIKFFSVLVFFIVNVVLYQNCQQGTFTTMDLNSVGANPVVVLSAPKILLTGTIPPLTNSRSVDINFKVETDAKTSLKSATCQLNALPPEPCTSQILQSYANLADGDYVVRINAEAADGQKASELSVSLRVDATAPVVNFTLSPPAVAGLATANFAFTATDALSQVSSVECSLDNAAFATCVSPMALTALAEGSHSFRIRGNDAAKNVSAIVQHSWSINLMAPALTITASPTAFTNVKTASFSFNGQANGAAITQFQCSLDNGAFAACVSPATFSNLIDGSHKFSLRGADINGVFSSPIMAQWTVDTVVPSTPQITTATAPQTKLTAASFSFASTDVGGSGVASYQCSMDNGAFAACTSPKDYTNLQNGSHSFRVKSVDNAANMSAIATSTWLVDNAVPTLMFSQTPPATTDMTSAAFAFSATDGTGGSGVSKLECSLDNAAFAVCTSPKNFTNLALGNHNFRIQATDAVGNVSAIAAYNWTITAAVIDWSISPINLTAGSNGTVDLKLTLPAGVIGGGVFSVDATGAALPAGMTLSANGILSVGSASVATTAGVIFSYNEP